MNSSAAARAKYRSELVAGLRESAHAIRTRDYPSPPMVADMMAQAADYIDERGDGHVRYKKLTERVATLELALKELLPLVPIPAENYGEPGTTRRMHAVYIRELVKRVRKFLRTNNAQKTYSAR